MLEVSTLQIYMYSLLFIIILYILTYLYYLSYINYSHNTPLLLYDIIRARYSRLILVSIQLLLHFIAQCKFSLRTGYVRLLSGTRILIPNLHSYPLPVPVQFHSMHGILCVCKVPFKGDNRSPFEGAKWKNH